MTVQKFNSLPLEEKEKYIFEIIKNQKVTVANDLVMKDMVIFFQCALFRRRKIIKAEAEPIPKEHLPELQKEFGNFSCILFNHNDGQTMKQYIFRAIEKITNRSN